MDTEMIGQTLEPMNLKISSNKDFSIPGDLQGRWTILYFYPKDDTPGCTVQACSYRDNLDEFKKVDAQVLGVSADDVNSHDAFTSKFDLNFPLIADTERKLHTALGVQSRDTFLFNPEGQLAKVWRGVSPKTTVEETLSAIGQ